MRYPLAEDENKETSSNPVCPMISPRFRSVRAARTAAFTLVELLTVIGVLGILVAILIPTVSAARKSARNTQCTSNLREWGRAILLYASENKGRYQFDGWASVPNGPYMRYLTDSDSQYRRYRVCPMIDDEADYNMGALTYSIVRGSINGKIDTVKANVNYVELSNARNPSQYLLIVDSINNTGGSLQGGDESWVKARVDPLFDKTQTDPRNTRHGSHHINGVFGDGSIRRITNTAAGQGDSSSIYEKRKVWFQLN